jgi:hypothetical protein
MSESASEFGRIGTDCEIGYCGEQAHEEVIHPQRGAMDVCPRHREEIQRVPERYFPGGGDT